MANIKYADLAYLVQSELPGCPLFVIERAMRETAIDFFTKTDIHIQELEEVFMVSGEKEYDLSAPQGSDINHVVDVFRNQNTSNSSYSPLTAVTITEYYQKQGSGTPQYYTMTDNDTILFAPTPSAQETLYVLYSLKPSQTSTSLNKGIANRNAELLAHGTLYRLQMMPEQAWSNPASAANNKVLYDKQMGDAIRKVKYGWAGAAMTASYKSFETGF